MTSNTTVQIWNGAINALVQTVIGLTLLCSTGSSARSDDATQTLVFIRHGEKPDEGLGQLSCQGLNRALALPPVIAKVFWAARLYLRSRPIRFKKRTQASCTTMSGP